MASCVNAAKVAVKASAAVIGTGGVGLSVIQGAVHRSAGRVVAIDINERRLELARQFGATDTILASRSDAGLLQASQDLKRLLGRGADYAFECTAVPELGAAPLALVRNGGMAVGVSGIEHVISFDMQLFGQK